MVSTGAGVPEVDAAAEPSPAAGAGLSTWPKVMPVLAAPLGNRAPWWPRLTWLRSRYVFQPALASRWVQVACLVSAGALGVAGQYAFSLQPPLVWQGVALFVGAAIAFWLPGRGLSRRGPARARLRPGAGATAAERTDSGPSSCSARPG